MLTTASITFSAMSAMPSGPRANAGAEANNARGANRHRGPEKAQATAKGWSGTGHIGFSPGKSGMEYRATLRPNGAAAQACERDISGEKPAVRGSRLR